MRPPRDLSALITYGVLAAAPAAAAEGFSCRFDSGDASGVAEIALTRDGATWSLSVEGESFAARRIEIGASDTAHFLVAPVDKAADAVALISVFPDGKAFMSLHGDFFGGTGATREGTCEREGG